MTHSSLHRVPHNNRLTWLDFVCGSQEKDTRNVGAQPRTAIRYLLMSASPDREVVVRRAYGSYSTVRLGGNILNCYPLSTQGPKTTCGSRSITRATAEAVHPMHPFLLLCRRPPTVLQPPLEAEPTNSETGLLECAKSLALSGGDSSEQHGKFRLVSRQPDVNFVPAIQLAKTMRRGIQ
jgi:hypothetical protein